MPLDAYSFCPGGTGKKIKFCCPDLLNDHQKIERMLAGGQFQAALSHVERLEEKHPGRACLMAHRCLLLDLLDRVDEGERAVAQFLEHHPTNPIALAERALIAAMKEGGLAAIPWLQRAMEAIEKDMPARIWQIFVVVGEVLADEGEFLAGRAMLLQAHSFVPENRRVFELLNEVLATRDVPIWFKDDFWLAECPDNAPWKADFDAAVRAAYNGRWSVAQRRFLAIAAQAGDQPAVWRNLATVRGWLGDREGCVKALRKYARLDIPLEDAVEAEAMAMILSGDPLRDQVDVVSLTYPIVDVEQFQIAIASTGKFRPLPVDLASLAGEDRPPPLAVYMLLDGDMPSGDAPIDPENAPRVLCHAAYYGKQTDQEARLHLFPVSAAEEQSIQRLVTQTLFGVLGPLAERHVIEQVSRTRELMTETRALPSGASGGRVLAFSQKNCQQFLLQKWPECPLGVLDDKTPKEAAQDPKYLVPLLAAILVIEFWTQLDGFDFESDQLRARLGLPSFDPIDPEQVDISTLPIGRLSRVIEQKAPREKILEAFQRAVAFHHLPSVRKLGRALVDHPESTNLAERRQILALMARSENNADRSLALINEGRKLAEAEGVSSALWDLMELALYLTAGDSPEATRLLNHLIEEHIQEPGVAASVRNVLVRIGAMRPDGTLVNRSSAPSAAEPSMAVSNPQDAEPAKLWTPGGESAKPKLWLPGSE